MKRFRFKYYLTLAATLLGLLAFWGAVIFVIIHFICKFW